MLTPDLIVYNANSLAWKEWIEAINEMWIIYKQKLYFSRQPTQRNAEIIFVSPNERKINGYLPFISVSVQGSYKTRIQLRAINQRCFGDQQVCICPVVLQTPKVASSCRLIRSFWRSDRSHDQWTVTLTVIMPHLIFLSGFKREMGCVTRGEEQWVCWCAVSKL